MAKAHERRMEARRGAVWIDMLEFVFDYIKKMNHHS